LLLKIAIVDEYETKADNFVGGPRKFGTFECKRKCGHMIRYSLVTKEFGILDQNGIILTYFIPERHKHGKWIHLCYFCSECAK
jgi:hypothetical protein